MLTNFHSIFLSENLFKHVEHFLGELNHETRVIATERVP